jgi:hypothetical protein
MNERRVQRMLREMKEERRFDAEPLLPPSADDPPIDSWLLWAAVTVVLMATTVI